MQLADVQQFFQQLEGPYKWYVIAGVLVVLTALFSRLVFKTLRWFFLLIGLIVIMLAVMQYFL
jgi:uncharacterized protein (DUF983 family)